MINIIEALILAESPQAANLFTAETRRFNFKRCALCDLGGVIPLSASPSLRASAVKAYCSRRAALEDCGCITISVGHTCGELRMTKRTASATSSG
jgi:hypothetical protein